MKKQDAFTMLRNGETVYYVGIAYCRNKVINQNILVMNHKPVDEAEFDNALNVFKDEFKQSNRFPNAADRFLRSFFQPHRRFTFKFLKELPKNSGIIVNDTDQEGETA